MTNVDAENNSSYGAKLTNKTSSISAGITITGQGAWDRFSGNGGIGLEMDTLGKVIVSNVEASGNSNTGLDVDTKNAITITNITANTNSGDGVYLNNQYIHFTGAVSITSTSGFSNTFKDNGKTGLTVWTNGAITLANLVVESNGDAITDYGVYLNNADYSYDTAASAVKVSNSIINDNGDDGSTDSGLYIDAIGAVTLTNVTANGNTGTGIYIDNSYLAKQNITLTNLDTCDNATGGVYISTTGNVVARDLTALDNDAAGVEFFTSSVAKGFGSVTLSGVNFFNGNRQEGLFVRISNWGNLKMSNITAEKNVQEGIYVEANNDDVGTITITNASLNFNGSNGLLLEANNTILLNTIYALNNGVDSDADGIYIDQQSATATTTIQNSTLLWNTQSGLEMYKNGAQVKDPIIKNTLYFGNNADGIGNELDIYIRLTD